MHKAYLPISARSGRLIVAIAIGCAAIVTPPRPAFAEERRFWLLEETTQQSGQNCPSGDTCVTQHNYTARAFPPGTETAVTPLLGLLTTRATQDARLSDAADAPHICKSGSTDTRLGFDPETVPPAHRLAALRGITAVGLDLRKIQTPNGAGDDFGANLQSAFTTRLQSVGLNVVSPAKAEGLPGRPTLNVFVSYAGLDGSCSYSYSIFASLSQTALLTRDLQTKVVVGVWSLSAKSPANNPAGTEFETFTGVADALAADYRKANQR